MGDQQEVIHLIRGKHSPYLKTVPGGCYYCDRAATGTDHIVPVFRCGNNFPINRIPACSKCNSKKGSFMPDVFLSKLIHKNSFYPELSVSQRNEMIIRVRELVAYVEKLGQSLYGGKPRNKKGIVPKEKRPQRIRSRKPAPKIIGYLCNECGLTRNNCLPCRECPRILSFEAIPAP